ncbi:MAG: SDR family oxidoreductase [Dehalococcoidales bacterium]|nr:SDR family oxidoreductase [Dehalococcoidales bacterium]
MTLKGKTALITGGGTGIGAAIARRFVKEGAKICIVGRRREKLEQVAGGLPEGSVLVFTGDVSRYEEIKAMVAATVKFGGGLDILVNNAATDSLARITELDPDEWRKVIDVNLTAPFLFMKESIPHMIKAGSGSVINIASLGGLRCIPACPAYSTTKAGLIMLTQQAALDYGQYKIRFNAVCPGATRTDMLEKMVVPLSEKLGTDKAGGYAHFTKDVPLRRTCSPDEIAGLCNYLASDESSFMTGSVLLMDGGAAIVDVSGAAVSDAGL